MPEQVKTPQCESELSQDLFKKQYPNITNLYLDFISSPLYDNHPITTYIDNRSSDLLAQAIELLQKGNPQQADDKLLSACCDYQNAGFIFGFTYAQTIMGESMKAQTAQF